MAKCHFCKEIIKPGRGITLVALDGKSLNFCSSKCRKNFNLGRNPKKVKWIKKKKSKA